MSRTTWSPGFGDLLGAADAHPVAPPDLLALVLPDLGARVVGAAERGPRRPLELVVAELDRLGLLHVLGLAHAGSFLGRADIVKDRPSSAAVGTGPRDADCGYRSLSDPTSAILAGPCLPARDSTTWTCGSSTPSSEDGRRPFTSVAEDLGVAEATVRSRVARLQRIDAIRFVTDTRPHELGYLFAYLGRADRRARRAGRDRRPLRDPRGGLRDRVHGPLRRARRGRSRRTPTTCCD